MSKFARSRVVGPLAGHADGFRLALAELGYTFYSAETHVWLMGRLSRWLLAEGLQPDELGPAQVARFLTSHGVGRNRVPTDRMLRPMLDYLRGLGVAPTPSLSDSLTPLDELLDQYRRWLVEERGLAARTVVRYAITARRFLGERAGSAGGGTGVAGLTGADVTGFLLRECDRLSVGSAKVLVADLRSLLRFLSVQGHTGSALAAAVPPVAGWRDTAVPSTLTATQVAALLDSCDRTLLIGLRDFAILTMVARLGLRAAEVAGLELSDVNWRAGEIVVRGKGRRDERLPLPAEVGQALAEYLLARPVTGCRTLFITCRAPIGALNPNTVSRIVLFACLRAGIPPVRAHRLRHTLATEMLAHGASLADISQVLRHRDLATTAVYAKVDRAALSQVAAPWPGAMR